MTGAGKCQQIKFYICVFQESGHLSLLPDIHQSCLEFHILIDAAIARIIFGVPPAPRLPENVTRASRLLSCITHNCTVSLLYLPDASSNSHAGESPNIPETQQQ